MNKLSLVIAATLISATLACQAQVVVQPHARGIESPDYVWNEVREESLRTLRADADAKRGAATYRLCHGCHRAGGLGSDDGIYPRLAGQHETVLIKQLADIRTGRRDNPTMYPFASEREVTTQDIADLARYLSALPTPANNAKGSGKALARGSRLYQQDCATCHGKKGFGVAAQFYPRVAGQHYPYLKKEMTDIAKGIRRNANPRMAKIVQRYSEADIAAVSDFMSRLPPTP